MIIFVDKNGNCFKTQKLNSIAVDTDFFNESHCDKYIEGFICKINENKKAVEIYPQQLISELLAEQAKFEETKGV